MLSLIVHLVLNINYSRTNWKLVHNGVGKEKEMFLFCPVSLASLSDTFYRKQRSVFIDLSSFV